MQVLLLGQTDPGLKQRMRPVMLRGQVCFWWFWCLQKLICLWLMLLLYCAPPAETLYDRAWHSFSLLCISVAKKHSWWEIQGLDHAEKNGTRHVFSQTFAIVQVHVDRLALTEGAESNHVFVRVEWNAVESSGVTKLRVDCNLVTWEDKTAGSCHYAEYCQTDWLLYYRKHNSHLCLYSRHMPSRPRYQRR